MRDAGPNREHLPSMEGVEVLGKGVELAVAVPDLMCRSPVTARVCGPATDRHCHHSKGNSGPDKTPPHPAVNQWHLGHESPPLGVPSTRHPLTSLCA